MYGGRRRPRRASRLTEDEEVDLVTGLAVGEFGSEKARKAAWLANRDRLLLANAGRRPEAFWRYEAPHSLDLQRPQDEQLWAMDLLTPEEREDFEARCRGEGRSLASIPPPGYRVPDPRLLKHD
jgi:hypothetical protein